MRTFEEVPAEDATGEAATDFTEAESVPAEIPETPAQSDRIDQQPVQEEAATPTQDAASATPTQTDAPDTIDNFEAPEAVRRGLSGLLRDDPDRREEIKGYVEILYRRVNTESPMPGNPVISVFQ